MFSEFLKKKKDFRPMGRHSARNNSAGHDGLPARPSPRLETAYRRAHHAPALHGGAATVGGPADEAQRSCGESNDAGRRTRPASSRGGGSPGVVAEERQRDGRDGVPAGEEKGERLGREGTPKMGRRSDVEADRTSAHGGRWLNTMS
jgi:hypothetical protein